MTSLTGCLITIAHPVHTLSFASAALPPIVIDSEYKDLLAFRRLVTSFEEDSSDTLALTCEYSLAYSERVLDIAFDIADDPLPAEKRVLLLEEVNKAITAAVKEISESDIDDSNLMTAGVVPSATCTLIAAHVLQLTQSSTKVV